MNFRLPLLASLLILSLAACTGPSLRPGGETLSNDRSVVRALAVVEATEAQQNQVLAAYDTQAQRRRELEKELTQLERERRGLDPRQPDFLPKADAWIARWSQLSSERMGIQARFDQAVSQILDASQWRLWTELTTPRTVYGDYRDNNGSIPTRGERR